MYSHDLPQGGLEIPCTYIFRGDQNSISKVMRVLALIFPVITIDSSEALPKKRKTDEINSSTEMELWLEFHQLRLSFEDKEIIKNGSAVNDRIMNFAQSLIQHQFSHKHICGLQSTLLQQCHTISLFPAGKEVFQVIHCHERHHWVVVSTISLGGKSKSVDSVTIYDSLFTSIDDGTMHLLKKLFGRKVTVEMAAIQKQVRSMVCLLLLYWLV